jgi:hypothetical protein
MSIKLSRKAKDILFVSVGGFGWSDYADSKFWQVAWNVLGGLGIIGFLGGIKWKSDQREPIKPDQ